MHIFIDADACPVVGIVEKIAKKYNLPYMRKDKVLKTKDEKKQ